MIDEPILGNSLGIDFSLAGLSELRGYYETIERVLEETGKWQLASIDKRAKKLSVEKQQYYKDFYRPSRWLLSFPSELRASIVISGMSFLESQLWQICLSAQFFSKKEFKKPNKNILHSYGQYLQDYGNLDINNSKEWQIINKIYLLRNQLVHNGMNLGNLDDNSTKMNGINNIVIGLCIDEEGYYFIDKKLCDQMFDCIQYLLEATREDVITKWEV